MTWNTAELNSFYTDFGEQSWTFDAGLHTVLFVEKDRILRVRSADFGSNDNPKMFDTWLDLSNKKWYVRNWTREDYAEYKMDVVDWPPVDVKIQQPKRYVLDDGSVQNTFSQGDSIKAFFMPKGTETVNFKGKLLSKQTFQIDIKYNADYVLAYGWNINVNNKNYYVTQVLDPEQQLRKLELTCVLTT